MPVLKLWNGSAWVEVQGPQGPPGPGFYGVTVKQIDYTAGDIVSHSGISTLGFGEGFYITQNVPNTDEVVINLKAIDHSQYLLTNGSRPLISSWDNIGQRIRNTGVAEVAGTAPSTPATGVVWLDTATAGTGTLTSIATITTSTSIDSSYSVVLCNATSGGITVTLPSASGHEGRIYHVKKIDASVNAIIVDGADAETIDGELTQTFSVQYESLQIVCDGSNWHIL